ncbi:MAG TPA: AAA family ATPase [Puia sp.]|uniref:AAA family ATPase n=1 Tax=Puia sp. TaxID=2045100 RepID=UPI002B85D91F|nr:AAA family ATPase [Puia sp.]HVU96916.1 AAA family ATPase [Puia sp.]
MNKPALVIVTGRPASGKTTLAHLLANELRCPLISRDELKEGYVNTLGAPHHQLDDSAAWHIYETFFAVIELLLAKNISIVVEAAFQDRLWKQRLPALAAKTSVKVIICNLPFDLARQRFIQRRSSDAGREKFHGDESFAKTYEPLSMNVPTLEVDTTQDYRPNMRNIIDFLLGNNGI